MTGKKTREEELKKEIEEREKTLGIEESHQGRWSYQDTLIAELKGIQEGTEQAKQDTIKQIEHIYHITYANLPLEPKFIRAEFKRNWERIKEEK